MHRAQQPTCVVWDVLSGLWSLEREEEGLEDGGDCQDPCAHGRLQHEAEVHREGHHGGNQCLSGEDDRFPRSPVPLLSVGLVHEPVASDELGVVCVSSVERHPDDDQQDEEEGEGESHESDDAERQMCSLETDDLGIHCPHQSVDDLCGVLRVWMAL